MKASGNKAEIERKKKLAYTLFVDNGFEQKVIASITGISEKGISQWKKKDKEIGIDWEADRIELKQGFDKERRRLKKHINTILDEVEKRVSPLNVPNSSEADSLNKLASAAEKLLTNYHFLINRKRANNSLPLFSKHMARRRQLKRLTCGMNT